MCEMAGRVEWMERKSKWKMEMTGDKGRDSDGDDGGDLAVCLEIILQLPAIRLQTTAAEAQCEPVQWKSINTCSTTEHSATHSNGVHIKLSGAAH